MVSMARRLTLRELTGSDGVAVPLSTGDIVIEGFIDELETLA